MRDMSKLLSTPQQNGIPDSNTFDAICHDFHNRWGTMLCELNLAEMPIAGPIWSEFSRDSLGLDRRYDDILSLYNDLFE
jgi:hypothetical protein